MIDSHAHLNASYTTENIRPIMERFSNLGGQRIIDVTTSTEDFFVSQQLISKYPAVIYANVGLHPESPDGSTETWEGLLTAFEQLTSEISTAINIIGIGETGLDYSFYEKFGPNHTKVIEQQRELFILHAHLAEKLDLPLVIHARGKDLTDYSPYTEIFRIVDDLSLRVPLYLHSFAGDWNIAEIALKRGYVLGVNGIVTYSGAQVLADVTVRMPLDRLLLETDSPFLIPSNIDRSKELGNPKTNEPLGIFWTAKRVAKLRQCQPEQILELATNNAKRFFVRML